MTQREKRLAAIVGVLVALVSVGYVGWRIYDSFAHRASQLANLQKLENENNLKTQQGLRAGDLLQQYANRALPSDPNQARAICRDWLLKIVNEVDLKSAKVTAEPVYSRGDIYTVHPFKIAGEGDVQQLTDLLFGLYAGDVLHRVQLLTITPAKDKKELQIAVSIEAIALPTAPDRKAISSEKAALVAGHDREYYRSKIVGRNVFAPENVAPKLRGDETLVAYRGQPVDFTAQAEDPDKLDSVKFEADVSKLPGATFSTSTGKLNWTPKENGEFQMTLVARDNGFPSREVKRDLKITVKDPPPRTESRPNFDAAKHAYITGVTDRNGEPEVWLTIRTEGRTLRLGVGDTFRVGEMEGKIAEVRGNQVVIDAGGEQITARLGHALVQ